MPPTKGVVPMRHSRWPGRGRQLAIGVSVILLGTATACSASGGMRAQLAADRVVEQRVDNLLRQMTLAEKLQQVQLLPDFLVTDNDARNGLGSAFSITDPVRINHLQHVAVEQSRHHAAPAIRGVAIAVDEDDRRTMAGVDDVRRDAVHLDEPVRELAPLRVVQAGVPRASTHRSPLSFYPAFCEFPSSPFYHEKRRLIQPRHALDLAWRNGTDPHRGLRLSRSAIGSPSG